MKKRKDVSNGKGEPGTAEAARPSRRSPNDAPASIFQFQKREPCFSNRNHYTSTWANQSAASCKNVKNIMRNQTMDARSSTSETDPRDRNTSSRTRNSMPNAVQTKRLLLLRKSNSNTKNRLSLSTPSIAS